MSFHIGIIDFLRLFRMVRYGIDFLCNLIGFFYPAYKLIKAIISSRKNVSRWAKYWLIYSVYNMLEFFADWLLFRIQFYWFFKWIFLLWCMMPIRHNGAEMIYNRLINVFFRKILLPLYRSYFPFTKFQRVLKRLLELF